MERKSVWLHCITFNVFHCQAVRTQLISYCFLFQKTMQKGCVDRVLDIMFPGDAGRRKISCVYPWHSCSQSVCAQHRLSSTRSWFSFPLCSLCLHDTVWLKWAHYVFGDTYPGFTIFKKIKILSVQGTSRPACYRS